MVDETNDPEIQAEATDPGEDAPDTSAAEAAASSAAVAAATKGGLTIVAVITLVLFLLLTILMPIIAGPAGEASQGGMDIGDCEGNATSAQISPSTVDPTVSTGVYTAELKGEAQYFGSVDVNPADPRNISGQITIATPPLVPGIPVGGSWGPDGDELSADGRRTWDIPTWAPRDVVIKVSGFHNEVGASCSGFVLIRLEGSPFDSPLVWVPIVLLIIFVIVFLIAVKKGKPVLAGIFGLLTGGAAGTAEIFLGMQQLDGPAPTVLAIAGLVAGVVAASAQKKANQVA